MSKKVICPICLGCMGVVFLAILCFQNERNIHDAESFVYDSEKQAIVMGIQSTFQEWYDMTFAPSEGKPEWHASEQKVAATYETQEAKYCLVYLDYPGKEADYLDFFLAEIRQKQNKYSFKRITAFYGLVPEGQKESLDHSSEVMQAQITATKESIPLYFACGKLKDTDIVYVDDMPKENIAQPSNCLGLKTFGVIDTKRHDVVVQ